MPNKTFPVPTVEELEAARAAYERLEIRDLFYRTAIELVESALTGQSNLSLAEAIAVLLQTWNQAFYRFHPFDERHISELENLLDLLHKPLISYRKRHLASLTGHDEALVKEFFSEFEKILYPVGAAKCIHLLAPHFFPLWDRAIAAGYGLPLNRVGQNAGRYWNFMQITSELVKHLENNCAEISPLKALDEYNYCVHTKRIQLINYIRKDRPE
jgi:hypothetical protein